MLLATVLGSGLSPGQTIDARSRARTGNPGSVPRQHLAQPLSLDSSSSPSSSSPSSLPSLSYSNAYGSSATYNAFGESSTCASSRPDYGDEALTWAGNEVTWSRGAEVVRRFTFTVGNQTEVLCATFAWFTEDASSSETQLASSPSSEQSDSFPAGPSTTSTSTPTFGPFHTSQHATWTGTPTRPSNRHLRKGKHRAVVVVLAAEAHIFFASGEVLIVNMPFRVEGIWPLPTGGILIQRALEARESRARASMKPRPSMLDRTTMSVLEDMDETPPPPLPMLYTLTSRHGDLRPVHEASLAGEIHGNASSIVPGTLSSRFTTSQTVLYVAPDPYPFIVVYDKVEGKVILFRREIVPMAKDDVAAAPSHNPMLLPHELLRQTTTTAATGSLRGRPSVHRVASTGRISLAPSAADPLDRARRKSRLSTTSFVADDDFDFEAGPFAMEAQMRRGKRIPSMGVGLGVPEGGRISSIGASDLQRSVSTTSNRRLNPVAETRMEWEFPKSSRGMLADDLRDTTMMAGLNHDVERSEVVLERIWEWQPPARVNADQARVFLSENRSRESVHLNLVFAPEDQPTSLFTFHVQLVTSPVTKYMFQEVRQVQCLTAAPIISTRPGILDTLVMLDGAQARLITSQRMVPVEIPRVPTVDGRDEVARKLASSLSMTLEGDNEGIPGVVDLVDPCGSRVTVVYKDGDRVRVSLSFTLPSGLARRSLEALSYALSETDYEELLDTFLTSLQARPTARRLEPGVHWDILAEILYAKCGIPNALGSEARGEMLTAWSTQSDPVLRRLAQRVAGQAAQPTHASVAPAPSTGKVLLALHLVAQDCRLACSTEPELSLIAPVIFSLASAVGRADWIDYWRRIMPTALFRSVIAPPTGKVDTTVLDTWDEPPDVLTFLERTMMYSTTPFPLPESVFSTPPPSSPLGQPKPCTQTETLCMLYSLMRPSTEERGAPRQMSVSNRARAVITYMVARGLSRHWLADLPFGVSAPVLEMIRACNLNPPKGVSEAFYAFVGRPDLAANCQLDKSALDLPVGKHEMVEDVVPTVGELLSANPAKQHSHLLALPHVRFGTDKRLEEIERIMQTTRLRTMTIDPPKGASEADFMKYQEQVVATIAQRTLAVTVGQGMFVYGSRLTPSNERWEGSRIELAVKVLPSNIVNRPPFPEGHEWPTFHSGASAALAYSPECKGINSNWIAYNRPSPLTPDHAGFLLGLGLQGHLRALDSSSVLNYLDVRHEFTTIGMTLGLGASFAGSQDLTITRLLCLHTTALLPKDSMPLNVSVVVQSVALVAIGLVFAGSRNLRMAEVALREISRKEMPGVDAFTEYREAYNLSSAAAFGLIMLGRGGLEPSEVERKMIQQLTLCIHGNAPDIGRSLGIRRVEPIDTTLTAPGATLALGLMFLKTGRKDVASILSIPQTPLELESVRPEHLLIRTFARSLIMWDEIEGATAWFDAQLPPFIRAEHHDHKRTGHLELIWEVAYFNIMAGACLGLAFRFAGSANESIHNILTSIFSLFGKAAAGQSMTYEGKIRRNAARQALNIVSLAAAIEMAGTGELGLTRRLRMSHGQEGASINYGSHMAMHMALGILYLGRGYYTIGNSNLSIAALAIACFPRFLPSMADNKAYPQAFRHLWVLAVEPRCLIARDVDTRESIFLPVKLFSNNSPQMNNLISPTLVGPIDTLKSIVIDSPRYLPVTLEMSDSRDRNVLVQTRTIWVKRRAGYIDYADDPRGYRSLMVRAGTMSGFDLHYDLVSPAAPLTVPPAEVVELVTTHSTNPVCIAIARNFSGDTWLEAFARNVLFECLSIDKLLVLGTYLSMALGLLSSDDLLLERMAQTRFAHRFYRPQVWDKFFALNGTQKRHPIVRQTFLAAMARKFGALAAPPPSRFDYFSGRAIVGDLELASYLVRNNVPPSNLLQFLRDRVTTTKGNVQDLELQCRFVAERYMESMVRQYGEGGGELPLWKIESVRDAVKVWTEMM